MKTPNFMKTPKTPKEFAEMLIREKFSINQYEQIQNRRKERLAFWEKVGMSKESKEVRKLIKFGEEVLILLKKSI